MNLWLLNELSNFEENEYLYFTKAFYSFKKSVIYFINTDSVKLCSKFHGCRVSG